MAKLFRACTGTGLLLAACCFMSGRAQAQDLGPGTPGLQQVRPDPSDPAGIMSKYQNDPLMLHALREQARLRGAERQKQIVDATNLLLQIAHDLRTEIATPPTTDSANTEKDRLEHIQKLARVIKDREKTEDNVSSDLAKAGVWP
ncbi:MAG: hypothetical protein WBW84_05735 [Acidobacteriaceae bacterium]